MRIRHRSGGSTAHWAKEKERSVKVHDLGTKCRGDMRDARSVVEQSRSRHGASQVVEESLTRCSLAPSNKLGSVHEIPAAPFPTAILGSIQDMMLCMHNVFSLHRGKNGMGEGPAIANRGKERSPARAEI